MHRSLEVAVGNCVTAEVSYLHPLAADLFGVEVCLTADEKLSTNGTLVEHSFSLGTVTNGQWINVSTNFTAGATGSSTVWATIIASNLVGIGMSKDISVVE